MDEKLKVRVFRHKTYKDVFLARNWCICGANSDTYRIAHHLLDAIDSANTRHDSRKFEDYLNFTYMGKGLTVTHKLKKDMEFDGYTGTLVKEVELNVSDFEEIYLTEN